MSDEKTELALFRLRELVELGEEVAARFDTAPHRGGRRPTASEWFAVLTGVRDAIEILTGKRT